VYFFFIFAFKKKTSKKFDTAGFIFTYTLISFSWMMKFESACPGIWLHVHIWIIVFWRKQLQWITLRSPISFDSFRRTATKWCEWIIYFLLLMIKSTMYLHIAFFYSSPEQVYHLIKSKKRNVRLEKAENNWKLYCCWCFYFMNKKWERSLSFIEKTFTVLLPSWWISE